MRITCLAENTKGKKDLGTEHGLSLYIEKENYKILFDMGQTNLFEQNAYKLGVKLEEADMAVLSHGHYDHGGGLKRFLEINKKAPVYLSKYAFGEYYNGKEKYIGLDLSIQNEERLVFVKEDVTIEEGIRIYTGLRKHRYDIPGSGFYRKEGNDFHKEEFLHEQYLLVEEAGVRVLFSGCSHRGILTIADEFCPDYLIGGFHFSKLPLDDKLQKYGTILDQMPTQFYTCHCTGREQFEFMNKVMKKLYYLSTGDVIEL